MKEQTAELLANALTETLEAAGLSAAELLEGILEMDIPAKYKKFVRMGFKGEFKQDLLRQAEPDKNELAQGLAALNALKGAPHKLRSIFKKQIKQLPRGPSGPPRKVKREEELLVCAEIMALRNEYDTRGAIRQVARKRGASERTIYRIWGKYHPKKKKPSHSSS